ncbi:heparinase II/III family protein [Sphingomonas quercus]|nr:heparinase II/III family protein [Sphingomonas quercus]
MGGGQTDKDGPDTIRAGNRPREGLAARFVHSLHRASWRTPFHALRLRGHQPLKLRAIPADPVPGDAAAGQAMLSGTIRHGGEEATIAGFTFAIDGRSPAFADHMQSFAWLPDLAAAGPRSKAATPAELLLRRWLAHEGGNVGPGWRPELCGQRILHWAAHAPLLLASGDPVHRSAMLNALARMARHLDGTADKAPAGLPRVAACAGLVTAALLIPGREPRLARGMAALDRALVAACWPDGGLIGRAPVDLVALVTLLARLGAVFEAADKPVTGELVPTLARAVPALLGVTMGDGALGSWQGGCPLPAERIAAVIEASGIRTRPLRRAREWGYQRLVAGPVVVVADCAPPPAAASATGSASTLAFEMSDGPRRLIVNCGGGRPVTMLDGGLAEALRTTAAHSTVTLDDTNSTAILPDGTLGRGVGEVELDRREDEGGSSLEASHDGYVRRYGLAHRRRLALSADGKALVGADIMTPAGRGPRHAAGFAVRFHLGPGVEASATADGQGALLRLPGGGAWQFRAKGGAAVTLDASLWVNGEGRTRPTTQIVVTGEAGASGATIDWSLRRVG